MPRLVDADLEQLWQLARLSELWVRDASITIAEFRVEIAKLGIRVIKTTHPKKGTA